MLADADFAPMVEGFDKMELDIRCSKHIYTIYTADHSNKRKLDWIYRNMPGVDVRRRTHQALHAPQMPGQDMYITEVRSLTVDEQPGGYQDRTGGSKGKALRYIAMLEADLRDYGPNDSRSLYYIGIGYYDLFAAALREQGWSRLAKDDWDALASAVSHMKRRVALPPSDDVGKKEERWFALLKLGEIYERYYGEQDTALQYYLHAARLDPERADAWFYAGQNLRLRGKAAASIPLLHHAASLPQPDRALFHWKLMYSCLPALDLARGMAHLVAQPGEVFVSDVVASRARQAAAANVASAEVDAAGNLRISAGVTDDSVGYEDEVEYDIKTGARKPSSGRQRQAAQQRTEATSGTAAGSGQAADPAGTAEYRAEARRDLAALSSLLHTDRLRSAAESTHADVLRSPTAAQDVLDAYVSAAEALPLSLHALDGAIDKAREAEATCGRDGEGNFASEARQLLEKLQAGRKRLLEPGAGGVVSQAEWRRRSGKPVSGLKAAAASGPSVLAGGPAGGAGQGPSRLRPLLLVPLPSTAALAPLRTARSVPFHEAHSAQGVSEREAAAHSGLLRARLLWLLQYALGDAEESADSKRVKQRCGRVMTFSAEVPTIDTLSAHRVGNGVAVDACVGELLSGLLMKPAAAVSALARAILPDEEASSGAGSAERRQARELLASSRLLDRASQTPLLHLLRLQLRDAARALHSDYVSRHLTCRQVRLALRPVARTLSDAVGQAAAVRWSSGGVRVAIAAGLKQLADRINSALHGCVL
jgi:tetratricopeptide (TPR) repeat protein